MGFTRGATAGSRRLPRAVDFHLPHHRREISRQDAFYSIIFGSDILQVGGKSGSLSGSISGSGYPFFRIGISLQSLTDSSTVIIHDNVQRSDRRISHRGSFASSLTSTHLRIFYVFDGVEPRARGAPRHLFGRLQARCRGLTDPRAGHLVDLQGIAETNTAQCKRHTLICYLQHGHARKQESTRTRPNSERPRKTRHGRNE